MQQVAGSPKTAPDPVIEALKLMSDPSRLKETIKILEEATKKHNKAKKALDIATTVAKTVEDANKYAEDRKKAIDELEAKRNKIDEGRKQHLSAQEMSIARREGAYQVVVREHDAANTATRDELSKQTRSLIARETTLARGNKQLAQDNASLKLAQDALNERRTRLTQALKG